MCRVAEVLEYYGRPFIIGGDLNMTETVLEHSGWLSRTGGVVQSVQGGTCRSAEGTWSNIDYFIVSRCLAPAVESVGLVSGEPSKPHVPVQLQLHESPKLYKELVLKKCKQFPLVHPIGCGRKPPC